MKKVKITLLILLLTLTFIPLVNAAPVKNPNFPTREQVETMLVELEESMLGIIDELPDFQEVIDEVLERLGILETEVDDLDTRVGDIEEEIEELGTSEQKQLKVYDANEQYLGLLIQTRDNGVEAVFHEVLGKVIDFKNDGTIERQGINYTDASCTPGNGFIGSGTMENYYFYDFLFHLGADRYGYIHPDAVPENVTFVAVLQPDGVCDSTGPTTQDMYPVVETGYPFGSEAALPFDVRYE